MLQVLLLLRHQNAAKKICQAGVVTGNRRFICCTDYDKGTRTGGVRARWPWNMGGGVEKHRQIEKSPTSSMKRRKNGSHSMQLTTQHTNICIHGQNTPTEH